MIADITESEKAKFWARVDVRGKRECWPWKRFCKTTGYGKFWARNIEHSAHRFAYAAVHGSIPTGKLILHSCDNKRCCNPSHLRAGTAQENSTDMATRRRARGGLSRRKLTMDQAREIRASYPGMKGNELAAKYGIPKSCVYLIVKGIAYREGYPA